MAEGESSTSRQLTRAQGLRLGIAIVIAGLLFATVVPLLNMRWAADLNAVGEAVEGQLLDSEARSPSGSTSFSYFVSYHYAAAEQRWCQGGTPIPEGIDPPERCTEEQWVEVNEPTFEAIRDAAFESEESQPIALRVEPSDPGRSHPVAVPRIALFVRWGIYIALAGALVTWVAWKYAPERVSRR
ncbi:DUF3592 domain-containing protein [Histidinibacterium aquaticum]|uniref:DUF3592 domain-containing protein n=1 Tax=Histidinibacterium aquaticum TaxID=2613962 RepID=A0A5J5GLK5_9RHOB|nr:DUF3592 domain-containing protein [Histidinibacterium aquaticum]KAA9009125.1 DUF3592 domain-containing protein [Histidinibacterium aquaticum]